MEFYNTSVVLVLGTRMYVSGDVICPPKLVEGRAKHDHDDVRGWP